LTVPHAHSKAGPSPAHSESKYASNIPEGVGREVLFEIVDDHVALVTLNRPHKRNAVNGTVASALDYLVKQVESMTRSMLQFLLLPSKAYFALALTSAKSPPAALKLSAPPTVVLQGFTPRVATSRGLRQCVGEPSAAASNCASRAT
jgi:hypothetical protein